MLCAGVVCEWNTEGGVGSCLPDLTSFSASEISQGAPAFLEVTACQAEQTLTGSSLTGCETGAFECQRVSISDRWEACCSRSSCHAQPGLDFETAAVHISSR